MKNLMKKIIMGALVGSLVLSSVSISAFAVDGAKDSKSVGAKATVKIKMKTASKDNKYVYSDISYPVLSGLTDKKVETKLNKIFKDQSLKRASDFEKNAIEEYKTSLKEKYDYYKTTFSETYIVDRNSGGIFSYHTITYLSTGGAHPLTYQVANNYNVKTGEKVTLKSLFKSGFNYITPINNEIKSQIALGDVVLKAKFVSDGNKAEEYSSPFYDPLFKVGVTNKTKFYLTSKSVVIYYDSEELTVPAYGMPNFEITFTKLKNGLKI